MKEQELAELDLAVAKAEGLVALIEEQRTWIPDVANTGSFIGRPLCVTGGQPFRPTRDPVEAMRLMEKYQIGVEHDGRGWMGWPDPEIEHCPVYAPTPCIAICKAVIELHKAKEPA